MIDDLVLAQQKILKIVREYFKSNNSPFLKKSYFALYENGDGSQFIKKIVYNYKINLLKKFLIKNINIFNNSNFETISNNNHKKYYDNLVITWGNEFSFLKNGSYFDKYFSTYSSKHKKTLWIILLNQKFNKKRIDNNIIVIYPKINLLNYLKFFKIFFYNLFCNSFGLKKKIIDQDLILSDYINDFIYCTKSLSNLKNLIMPYEGQAFQKNIFYKQKKLKKKIKTYGFDHSAPHSIATQLYYTPGSPDQLLVSGINTKKSYIKYYNWPQNKIRLTFPTRYKNFNKNDFVNKMFLPYDFMNEDKIFQSLDIFLRNRKDNSLKNFIVNIHPVKLKDKKHINLKKKIEKIKKKYKKKFSIKSSNNITIAVGFTTTPLVALEFKSSVLHICPNPDFDAYLNCFWPHITIKKINKFSFFYILKKKGKYLNFKYRNKIIDLLND